MFGNLGKYCRRIYQTHSVGLLVLGASELGNRPFEVFCFRIFLGTLVGCFVLPRGAQRTASA